MKFKSVTKVSISEIQMSERNLWTETLPKDIAFTNETRFTVSTVENILTYTLSLKCVIYLFQETPSYLIH
jgi:uncharacterized protein YqcC (DUF446 family)